MNGTTAGASNEESGSKSPPGARAALILLIIINLFNYIDRQVLAAVEPEIRQELLPDDEDAKSKTGLLSSAFLITYMITAPLFGWLAERVQRWRLIGIGVILWSVASGASGLNWGVGLGTAFGLLLSTRCFVGVGEGGYGPVAPALISDLFPLKTRGRVLSLFYLAIPVGSALGYVLGEQVKAAPSLGWRWAFYLVLPPGLILGILCFCMREPALGQADLEKRMYRKAGLKDYVGLFKIRSYVLDTMGMAAMTFAIMGLAFWMSAYLEERHAPSFGPLGPRSMFGAILAVGGLIATLTGGVVADRLRPRWPGSYFLVSGAMILVGFPFVLVVLWTPFPWAWIFIFLAVFCLFFNTGPTNSILANVTHPAIRASAFALNILLIHIFGDVISPPILGWIADRSESMTAGFATVSLMMLVGGVLWLWGARYLARDTELAPTRL